ncbi:MAG: hypothetical protein IT385_07845 [Deltaproteobacteria bacterium]|nr:hypothetical protein [Deltaproteobacteria bacterium]
MTAPRSAPLVLCLLAACAEDAVTLPESWNTLKHRAVTVDIYTGFPAPLDIVKPLSGLDGSPIGLEEGAPDLTAAWWDRPPGTTERDGAHVDVVRIVAEPCALTLDRLLPTPTDPTGDDLTTWEAQVIAAEAVRGDLVVWQAAFSHDGSCGTAADQALASPAPWGPAIVRALARRRVGAVELLDRQTLAREGGLALWTALAQAVRAHDATILVAGGDFVLAPIDGALDPESELARFIDRVADDDLPLDVLTIGVEADTPQRVAATTMAVRAALDAAGLDEVELGLTRLAPTPPDEALDPALASARRGAFEMAARLVLQDVPGLRFVVSDRGSAPGPYFEADGAPTPAFMARVPMRQVEGKARVASTSSAPDLVTLAATDLGGGRTLHLLVVAWDTSQGAGAVDYELVVPAFVPPAIERVDYRHAEVDALTRTLGGFFFSDVGALRPEPSSGDVLLRFRLPVPGVHYLELERPAPSL